MKVGESYRFCEGREKTYSFVIDSAGVVEVLEEVAVLLAAQETEFDNLEVVPEVAPVVSVTLGVSEIEMAEYVSADDVRGPGIVNDGFPEPLGFDFVMRLIV